MFRKLLSIVLLLFVSAALQAQQANNAILVGVISDSTGAFLPGATVTATHVATNTSVDILTDERGQYRTPPLRIGDYELTVRLDGFRTFVRRGVVLNIGDVRNVDVTLDIGAMCRDRDGSTRRRRHSTPSDSTVGTVITNEQIAALPLNGRDYLQLASLSSGTGPASSLGVVIGGQSGTAVAFLLDGHDNNSQQITTGHSGQKEIIKPSVDAIQEFKVVTNSYSAEYGRSSSGVVSVSLKSGTNSLNGSLYEFFRDDSLNATNYFATDETAVHAASVRRRRRLPNCSKQDLLLRRCRDRRHPARDDDALDAAVGDGASRSVLADDHRPADAVAVPRQPDSRRRASMPWRRASSATCRCPRRARPRTTSPTTARPIRTSRPGTFASTTCSARSHNAVRPRELSAPREQAELATPAGCQRQLRGLGASDISDNKSVVVVHNAVWSPQRHRVDPRGIQPHRLGRDRAATGSARRSASPASTPVTRASPDRDHRVPDARACRTCPTPTIRRIFRSQATYR